MTISRSTADGGGPPSGGGWRWDGVPRRGIAPPSGVAVQVGGWRRRRIGVAGRLGHVKAAAGFVRAGPRGWVQGAVLPSGRAGVRVRIRWLGLVIGESFVPSRGRINGGILADAAVRVLLWRYADRAHRERSHVCPLREHDPTFHRPSLYCNQPWRFWGQM